MSWSNKEKKKEYDKKWYQEHKEERKKTNHESYLRNKEKRQSQYKEYRKKHKAKYIKLNAYKRNIEYKLTDEEVEQICNKECFYCGETENIGIDRIDSNKGYVKENCVPCCGMCNRMKNIFSQDEFIAKCKKIAERMN